LTKVDVPTLVMYLNQTPILNYWCIIRCGSKIRYKKTCVSKNLNHMLKTILSSTVNIIVRYLYDNLMSTSIFTLMMNKIFKRKIFKRALEKL
jgi:hypothetical protein